MSQSNGIIKASTPPGTLPDMPINPDWITAGNPRARGTILVQSQDHRLHEGLWECEPGEFDWTFTWDEFARLSDGDVTITEAGGKSYTLGAGDLVHFPLGLKTHWNVRKTVKKVFFLRTPEPL